VATLLRRVESLEEAQERTVVLLVAARVAAAGATSVASRLTAGHTSVTSGLTAGHTSVAGGLAAASGVAAGLAAAITGVTGRLAASDASVASGLAAAIAAAVVLRLALREQALQPAEKIVLLMARAITAAGATSVTSGLAAGHTSIAGGLAAGHSGITCRLTAAASIAGGLAAASSGVTRRLTTRIGTAVVPEHPVKELETIRLATDGRTECQYAEVQHTLHRATSPLLVDHARSCVPFREVLVTPRLIHELLCDRPVEPIRDSKSSGCCRPLGCPTGTVMPRGTFRAIGVEFEAA